ncbi:malonic semialdehyde reductase [Saccharothrix coeruleofusca]|uniref:malonic semialdehyde reductase n=1 Tax=Saccharothrix coeruleofusca TaxID=33919 RepID=UPI001AE9D107|nr:malonic semialdehyde reductase [Saccharothrix coeruleofusca]
MVLPQESEVTHPDTAELALAKDAQDMLFRDARTVTDFQDVPVTDAQVRAIYDLVKHGPTAMNQQPLRAVLVRSETACGRLLAHIFEDNNKAETQAAPLSVVLAADLDFHLRFAETFPVLPDAEQLYAEAEPEARIASALMNAHIQLAYFIIGVRAAGLAAAPITRFDHQALDADFFPDGKLRAVAVVNVGVPVQGMPGYPRLPRLQYEDVFLTA